MVGWPSALQGNFAWAHNFLIPTHFARFLLCIGSESSHNMGTILIKSETGIINIL